MLLGTGYTYCVAVTLTDNFTKIVVSVASNFIWVCSRLGTQMLVAIDSAPSSWTLTLIQVFIVPHSKSRWSVVVCLCVTTGKARDDDN